MKYTKNIIVNNKPNAIPFTFPNKKEELRYIDICETIWGCVPIDVDWAIETKPYKRKLMCEC